MKTINFTAENYYKFATLVFFLAGIMLFFFVLLFDINIMRLQIMSNPLFYLVMGFICMFFYIGAKEGVID